MKNGCIVICGKEDKDYCIPLDLTVSENVKFAYDIGKFCREKEIKVQTEDIQLLESFYDRKFGNNAKVIHKLYGKEELERLIL